VCACRLGYPVRKGHAPYCIVIFSTFCHKSRDFLNKKLNLKCVFCFLYNIERSTPCPRHVTAGTVFWYQLSRRLRGVNGRSGQVRRRENFFPHQISNLGPPRKYRVAIPSALFHSPLVGDPQLPGNAKQQGTAIKLL
jgi:hypothetical protein